MANRNHRSTRRPAFENNTITFDREKLIHLIHKNEILWSQQRQNGQVNREMAEVLFTDIAAQVGLPDAATVRSKWRSLRDSYRTQKNRIRENINRGKPPMHEITWPYFEKMTFLDSVVKADLNEPHVIDYQPEDGETFIGCDSPEVVLGTTDNFECTFDEDQNDHEVEEIFSDDVTTNNKPSVTFTSVASSPVTPTLEKNNKKKRKLEAGLELAIRESRKFLETLNGRSLPYDEAEAYGMYVAAKLRKLNTSQQFHIRRRIDEAFLEIDMEEERNASTVLIGSSTTSND